MARRLEAEGATILARNVREGAGEIDLVAIEDGVMAVVEVKFRSASRYGSGEETVDSRKKARLRAAAAAYRDRAFERGERPPVRFDVALVARGAGGEFEIEILRDAFE